MTPEEEKELKNKKLQIRQGEIDLKGKELVERAAQRRASLITAIASALIAVMGTLAGQAMSRTTSAQPPSPFSLQQGSASWTLISKPDASPVTN